LIIIYIIYLHKLICNFVYYIRSTADSTTFVLNCANQKHVTYEFFHPILKSISNEVPLERIVWTPNMMYINNFVLFYILTMLLHILPAILVDLILKLSGHRSM